MSPPIRLYVSYDDGLDWLMACEFGRVDDAQPPENWRGVSERFGFLHDAPDGRVVGFRIQEFSSFDPDDVEVKEIWGGPRFHAPTLGLLNASAGEIVTAARAHFAGRDSFNRELFRIATGLSGHNAVAAWRRCLEAGDAMAHFGLGYTLLELGDATAAYRHLRHYAEIAPHGAWNWCWYGQAAEGVGEFTEARRAYRRAVELGEAGDEETDAAERLAALTQPAQAIRATGGPADPTSASDDAVAGPAGGASTTPSVARTRSPTVEMRISGCLFGGAVGDALGAPIEFDSIERIRKRFGPRGVTDYHSAYGRRGSITDDTQMSLFTAEGLIRAYVRGTLRGLSYPPSVVDHAYARWLATQGENSSRWDAREFDGWLVTNRGLHATRAPGDTCLSALRASRMGTRAEPLNDSKGCGGVMRIAPVGLLGEEFPGERFDLGCDIAALTHGHPSGYLTAGVLAEVVNALVWSHATLDVALDGASERLRRAPRHRETLEALEGARGLATSEVELSPEAIATLGGGWVAEEALAIGVYCALVARDFEHGVLLAVNHSGDSDSTGSITGNLLGAIHGYTEIPARWIDDLEMPELIESLCRDWNTLFASDTEVDLEGDKTWWHRYPGW